MVDMVGTGALANKSSLTNDEKSKEETNIPDKINLFIRNRSFIKKQIISDK